MSSLIVSDIRGTYRLKTRFQNLLMPLVEVLFRAGVRANQVTVAAALLSAACGVFLLLSVNRRNFLWLAPVLLVRMGLNAIDGMLARDFGQASRVGIYLNELGDAVSDIFLILPLAHVAGFSPFWIWIVTVNAVISEMAGVLGHVAGASRRYDGPMGKSDRAVVLSAVGLWVGIAGEVPPALANIIPRVMTALLLVTIIQRVRGGLREAEGKVL